ncbi:hypothetical protein EJB05_08659 [Eragrostis curvula]|uniref:Uncharacterized protein n=1 Tax=Eragrostis curvula TaxID=38414 RepID=A0A5J9W2Y5_9POAL|nr:hypothetical protein EJB05_08659 [Eragrostis curvula]
MPCPGAGGMEAAMQGLGGGERVAVPGSRRPGAEAYDGRRWPGGRLSGDFGRFSPTTTSKLAAAGLPEALGGRPWRRKARPRHWPRRH